MCVIYKSYQNLFLEKLIIFQLSFILLNKIKPKMSIDIGCAHAKNIICHF